MKYLLILGDGMSDKRIKALNGKTPLHMADTPCFDFLAEMGRNGLLHTIPEGFPPGSEVGNLSILGYDVSECFEGRGPLEAAAIGYNMMSDDLAMRCNIIAIDEKGHILNHHGNNISSEEGKILIEYIQKHLGTPSIKFFPGIQYRHLLIINGGEKGLNLFPPHENIGESYSDLLEMTLKDTKGTPAFQTAALLKELVEKSRSLLESHPINLKRKAEGKGMANLIWPWSEGKRPQMKPLMELYPKIKGGVMITAVDLLRGIAKYAGLKPVYVKGASGLADTNYEGKADAAIKALETNDFVFIHVEATDEASHDKDLELKIKTIEFLDHRILKPIMEYAHKAPWDLRIALLPDHPTSVESGKHLSDPVPFVIYQKNMEPDAVHKFDEESCASGFYGTLSPTQFINKFLEE